MILYVFFLPTIYSTCSGKIKRTRECPYKECEKPKLSEITWGRWSEWSACSCDGIATRSREIISNGHGYNKGISGPSLESKQCSPDCSSLQPRSLCSFSDWSLWSTCDKLCEPGSRTRSRSLSDLSNLSCNSPCSGNLVEADSCIVHSKSLCPNRHDCAISAWSSWSECSSECGGGQKTRRRKFEQLQSDLGDMCNSTTLLETTGCNNHACDNSEDCKWSDWSDWSHCSEKCGGGTQSRFRFVKQSPKINGKLCEALDKEQYRSCNPDPCKQDKKLFDPQSFWNSWSKWSSCSVACGGGFQTRRRTRRSHQSTLIFSKPKKYLGESSEFRTCNNQPCNPEGDIDCQFSLWSDWSDCSCSCNGVKQRSRRILKYAQNNGKTCDGALKETTHCNVNGANCGVELADCVLSSWSEWSSCSVDKCGGGYKTRSRSIVTNTSIPMKLFSGDLSQVSSCNTNSCCPECNARVDCLWTTWSPWSPCSKSCTNAVFSYIKNEMIPSEPYGTQTRHRSIKQSAANYGKSCGPLANSMEIRECNKRFCKRTMPKSCLWDEWSEWSDCSTECGVRRYSLSDSILKCDGKMKQTKTCNNEMCVDANSPNPIDGEWSEWGEWTACSCEGIRERSRYISKRPQYGGKIPTGPEVITGSCVPTCHQNEPKDCKLSSWSDWSVCDKDCGGGQQFRSREIERGTVNCGLACESAELKQTRTCNLSQCEKPVDCQISEWSKWSECDRQCGGGQKRRSRQIIKHASNGGALCSAGEALEEIAPCNENCCINSLPVDCVWGSWSKWSACSAECGGGVRTRDRVVKVAPRNGGKFCSSADTSETIACNTQSCHPVHSRNAKWGEWSKWSKCTRECGGGYQHRHRRVAQSAKFGGKQLEGASDEYRECNVSPCQSNAVNCEFSTWSDWSDCSCACNGHKSRQRRILTWPMNGGLACNGPTEETSACNVNSSDCSERQPHTDCEWSEWTDWSTCSSSCDGGDSVRHRRILVPSSHFGKPCEGPSRQVKSCGLEPCCKECAMDQNCLWGEWGDWSDCSAECGGGEKYRHRSVKQQAKNGGTPCDHRANIEVDSCNLQSCSTPQYCAWGNWAEWTECTAKCGGGNSIRERRLERTLVKPNDDLEIV